MSTCQSCGGVIGQDCFNPEECAWITRQQADSAQAYHYEAQQVQDELQRLKAEIAKVADKLINNVRNCGSPKVIAEVSSECGLKLRQLSAQPE